MASPVQRAAYGFMALLSLGVAGVTWHYTNAAARRAADVGPERNGVERRFWPNGALRLEVAYRHDVYAGEYRSWYPSGRPYERRHYVAGREEGLQQAWTEEGELYLNYEVRDGRRFGFVNAAPCEPVHAPQTGTPPPSAPASAAAAVTQTLAAAPAPRALPYYDEPTFTPRWTPGSHAVAPFRLTTQRGVAISQDSLRGRPYVASFLYTQCAAVCPLLVQQLSRVQRASGADAAHIVSFTVTPETDTPARLAAFGRERGIDPAAWSLVTGSRREIYRLASDSFFANDTRLDADDPTAFLHTEKLLLVDGEGRLRGVYNGTQPHAVDQLIADLERLRDTAAAGGATD